MDTYFTTLNKLLAAGATNFVLMGVPRKYCEGHILASVSFADDSAALWRAPGNLNNVANVKANCTQWNDVLKRRTATFNSNHPRVKATFIDIQPFFNQVLDDPTAYGAQDSTCYNQDGHSCCWQDGVHPSLAIHRVVGAGIQNLLYSDGFFPKSSSTALPAPISVIESLPLPGPNPRQALFDAELIS